MSQFDDLVQKLLLLAEAGQSIPRGNFELPKAQQRWEFGKGEKGTKASVGNPEAVNATGKQINDAINAMSDEQAVEFKSILTGYMTKYVSMDSQIRQLERTAEALGDARKNLEKAQAKKDFDKIKYWGLKVGQLKGLLQAQETDLQSHLDDMEQDRPQVLDQLKDILGQNSPTIDAAVDRYDDLIGLRREEANKGQGYKYLYSDIIKSIAEFFKNTKHSNIEKARRDKMQRKAVAMPRVSGTTDVGTIKKIMQAADPADKDRVIELINNMETSEGVTNSGMKKALAKAEVNKHYANLARGDRSNEGKAMKAIYVLAGRGV